MLLYWAYVLYCWAEAGVPSPPLYSVVDPSCTLSSHVGSTRFLLVISFRLLFRTRPLYPMYLRGWDVVRALLGLGISWHAYLNRLIPELSSDCRFWTLILYASTMDPHIHLCVARTKVMVILLLMYPQVLEYDCHHCIARQLAILFRVADASTPSST